MISPSLKRALGAGAAILVVGLLPGFFQQKRLGELRQDQEKLAGEAADLGLSGVGDRTGVRLTKRQRADLEKRVDRLSSGLIEIAEELEANEKDGASPDGEFQTRAMELMRDLAGLDAGQIQRVVQKLREADGLSNKTRSDILAFVIMTSADSYPEVAVAMYVESADLMEASNLRGQVISAALGRWAEKDPNAALAWIRKNSDQHSDVVDDDTRQAVLSGVAKKDPSAAFGLIDQMEFEDPETAVHAIMISGGTDAEGRTAVLKALREHLAGIADADEREMTGSDALELMARTIDTEGFDSLSGWIEDAKLTQEEKEQFSAGLTYFTTKQETGKWVEWLAANLSEEQMGDPVRELVSEWTQQDYQSAGKWLGTVADGPARVAAVEAYAEAVAEYDPQVAAQWALTLPPGEDRENSLRAVHDNWPADDPNGAAAFAREHGLE
jgi:hypothetical protein